MHLNQHLNKNNALSGNGENLAPIVRLSGNGKNDKVTFAC